MRRSCISCCRAAGRKRGDGMSDVIKDVLMGKLFGGSGTSSGGGSSGGGGGWPEVPDDGATYLYITLQEGRTSPMLGVGVNGTVTVDWGDGTEPDVLTGASVSTTKWTPNHDYAAPGDYVIRLAVDGEMGFTGESATDKQGCILRSASWADVRNNTYRQALRLAKVGANVTSIGSYAFSKCSTLKSIDIPESVTSIGAYAFMNCSSLESIVIPDGVTSIEKNTFQSCSALKSIVIPESVTTLGSDALSYCYCLTSIVIPKNMMSIGGSALLKLSGAVLYDFTACTAVPTLAATSAFGDIPADCEIRVPAALYDEWIAATNWATYADYIKAY